MRDCFRRRTLRTAGSAVKMPTEWRVATDRGLALNRRLPCARAETFGTLRDMTTSPTSRRPRPTTTIAAHRAPRPGCPSPTVSKVINGRSDVSLETRQRVEAVIREHGYERSRASVRSAPLLELIFHELESDWALEIIKGVEQVAGENDLAVVLSEMQGRRTPGRGWIEGVLARRPTGVIAVMSDLSDVPARSC